MFREDRDIRVAQGLGHGLTEWQLWGRRLLCRMLPLFPAGHSVAATGLTGTRWVRNLRNPARLAAPQGRHPSGVPPPTLWGHESSKPGRRLKRTALSARARELTCTRWSRGKGRHDAGDDRGHGPAQKPDSGNPVLLVPVLRFHSATTVCWENLARHPLLGSRVSHL